MADDLLQHSLCLLFTLCVFASTVRFLGNNPAAGIFFGAGGWLVVSHRVTAVIASRKRPVPFRTRKLSSIAPMVLHSGGCGRVGRRRTSFTGSGGVLEPPAGVFASSTPFFHARHRTRLVRGWPGPVAALGCSPGRRERGQPRRHRRGSGEPGRHACGRGVPWISGAGRGRSLTCACPEGPSSGGL